MPKLFHFPGPEPVPGAACPLDRPADFLPQPIQPARGCSLVKPKVSSDLPERNFIHIVERQRHPVGGGKPLEGAFEFLQQDRAPSGVQRLCIGWGRRPGSDGHRAFALVRHFVERSLPFPAPRPIDRGVRHHDTQPSHERGAGFVSRQLSPQDRVCVMGRAQQPGDNLLRQVLTLLEVPAGLDGHAAEGRNEIVGKMLPGDPVAAGAREGEIQVCMMEFFKGGKPSLPVRRSRTTPLPPRNENRLNTSEKFLERKIHGRIAVAASCICRANPLYNLVRHRRSRLMSHSRPTAYLTPFGGILRHSEPTRATRNHYDAMPCRGLPGPSAMPEGNCQVGLECPCGSITPSVGQKGRAALLPMRILTGNMHVPGLADVGVYESVGGYQGLQKTLREYSPSEVIEIVKRSGLRGRGGAGFPTGVKWGFVPKNLDKPIYLCVNADESEPGTFKDRLIIERDPHQLIEGTIISAYAIDCHRAFIYIRGEFVHQARILEKAVREAYARGFLGKHILGSGYDLDLVVHGGAGAYICGEETALLESLEGKRGHPRLKPPFPAVVGLYQCPTVVNNVETLANVPHIINNGADWFAGIGTERNTGTRLFGVSGHVCKPGVYEFPMGITLRELIFDHCGGIRNGGSLKAVVPGGSSVPVLSADQVDVRLDFDSLIKAGSMLGSAGVIVMDDSTCMVKAIRRITQFYAEESCGQCTQCREGTEWMLQILRRIEQGRGRAGELEILLDICTNMKARTICPLSDAAAMPVESYIQKFYDEFDAHIKHGSCTIARSLGG
jgi:NADH-quinone oxidoreductase subunit F